MTGTASEYRAMLDDVIARPDDDVPRLIFADWHEDNGQSDRAEFIRAQVAIAECEKDPERPADPMARLGWTMGWCREARVMEAFAGTDAHARCEVCLKKRERELLVRHYRRWLPPELWEAVTAPRGGGEPEVPFPQAAVFRRGFVESVACRLDDWLACGAAVVKAQPVRRVTVGKVPRGHSSGEYGWWRSDNLAGDDDLPSSVWGELDGEEGSVAKWKNYETGDAALDALSAALLKVVGGKP